MKRSTSSCSQRNKLLKKKIKHKENLHMKFKWMTAIAITAMAIISCSEDTEGIGASLTDENDMLEITTGSFTAFTRSIEVDSVYARNFDCHLGMVKDPETGAYVINEFMAQFNILEDIKQPTRDKIIGVSDDGDIAADSCEIWLTIDRSKSYGDSLTPIKINVLELAEPMSDMDTYYSNFDPISKGYIRENGLKKGTSFTLANLTDTDSLRNLANYVNYATISLNAPYTDKNGKKYDNYGTYILRSFYDHPEYFKNCYSFVNNVCPGFYFEVSDGLGVMAKIAEIDLMVYFHSQSGDSILHNSFFLSSTPEVLQTQRVYNDKGALQVLINDNSCTYLKAPAGIFTEVTLPIDDIDEYNQNDSLLSVSMSFQRQNSGRYDLNYPISAPSAVLMVHKDSLNSFFETQTMYNNRSTFMASLSSNAYTFTNIGNLVSLIISKKIEGLKTDPYWCENHPNWDKVVLVPIAPTYSSDSYGNQTITSVVNQMGLSSTRLIGGDNHPIDVNVIFAKFKED